MISAWPLCLLLSSLAFADEAATTVASVAPLQHPPDSSGGGGNGTGLLQLYEGSFRSWVKKPLVHGLLLPGLIGTAAALLTVCFLCCLHSCLKAAAKRRRKRRIRNLAEELKTDKAALLHDDEDDEDF